MLLAGQSSPPPSRTKVTSSSSSITLFGRVNSVNVQKAIWAFAEVGQGYKRIDAGMAFGVNDTPEFLALNPNGKVPTLVIEQPDGTKFVLWESNAIVRYIFDKWGPASTPESRSAESKWHDWAAYNLAEPMKALFWGLVRTPEADRNKAAIATAIKDASKAWGFIDERIKATGGFLEGNSVTSADVVVGSFLPRWFGIDFERPNLPHLQGYFERLRAREGFSKEPLS